MKPRDLSDVPYWTLKIWRDYAAHEEDTGEFDYDACHNRLWMAELNAEIARRCEQTHGQRLPDGYDIYGSPAWEQWWFEWTPGEPVPPQNPMGRP